MTLQKTQLSRNDIRKYFILVKQISTIDSCCWINQECTLVYENDRQKVCNLILSDLQPHTFRSGYYEEKKNSSGEKIPDARVFTKPRPSKVLWTVNFKNSSRVLS